MNMYVLDNWEEKYSYSDPLTKSNLTSHSNTRCIIWLFFFNHVIFGSTFMIFVLTIHSGGEDRP